MLQAIAFYVGNFPVDPVFAAGIPILASYREQGMETDASVIISLASYQSYCKPAGQQQLYA